MILERLYEWWLLFEKGGPLMYLIFLCSVTALAIIFERLWMLRSSKVIPDELVKRAESLLSSGKYSEARALLSSSNTSIARVLLEGMERADKGREAVREAMEDAGRIEATQLNQFVNMLGGIAGLSPLLGLLGTVIGMIQAFNNIVEHGVGNPGDVAGGISVALITTAAGLTVAIPAFIANRYFAGRVESLLARMEEVGVRFMEIITGSPEKTDREEDG